MYDYYHEVRYVLFGLTYVTLGGREYSTLSQKLVVIYNIKKQVTEGCLLQSLIPDVTGKELAAKIEVRWNYIQ